MFLQSRYIKNGIVNSSNIEVIRVDLNKFRILFMNYNGIVVSVWEYENIINLQNDYKWAIDMPLRNSRE